jgi:hypothetical protein
VRAAPEYNQSVVNLNLDDYDSHDRRREAFYESPDQKLRSTIFKFGEVVRPRQSLHHGQTAHCLNRIHLRSCLDLLAI